LQDGWFIGNRKHRFSFFGLVSTWMFLF